MGQERLMGQDLFVIEALRSHSETTHLVGFYCTSNQPEADNTQHSQGIDIHAPTQRDPDPQPQEASGSRPTP